AGVTLEVCIANWWANSEESSINASLSFHGVEPSLKVVTMHSSQEIQRLDVRCAMASQEISPTVNLNSYCQPLRLCEKYNLQTKEPENKDDIKMKSPINTIPPKINRHVNPSNNSSVSETPMDTHISNGYKETTVISETETEQSPENEEKLFNNLVKFVKDKLNTSTLSLTEFKKLLLLHPAGSPGDILTSGVSDALLLKAIAKCGGEEIDLKEKVLHFVIDSDKESSFIKTFRRSSEQRS
ncbi:Hypothetical predicted protein, partial [Paramuricea clavata]